MYEPSLLGLPSGLLGDSKRDIPALPELQICEVQDVLAYGRCYIVKAPGLPRLPAMLGSLSSSMLPIGVRDFTMLVPGSLVLCWISERYHAVILSVITSPMGSSQLGWPDSIVAAGHAGIFADQAHQISATKETSHGFLDFSAGSPVDVLPGDWGKTNELGMAFFLGRLMASIRAGELCKLEMHYADMLARLYSYNWQHYTAGSEDEAFDDEGEFTRVRGFSPYPWEAAGVSGPGDKLFDKQEALNPKEASDRFGMEPVDALQASIVRYKEFEGFLGDLRRKFVMMPNLSVPRRVYGRKATDPAQYKGLFEEILSEDGSYLLRSAKGIGFEKSIWIPVPEELYTRDNPKGDHDLTDPAGNGMNFDEYPAQDTAGTLVARTRDSQEHELNKRKSEPLNQRSKDWAIRDDIEGSKIETPGSFNREIPGLTPYSGFEQPLPPSQDEVVSPTGQRSSRYYESKAFIGILPDGSILLRDGYGSEIRMSGGNIELTCPGDVLLRNGRTVQVWGGKDVIIKSQGNTELSSATGSVRLKAEHNLEILGGNDGSGGVLIESRGYGSPDFSNIGADQESIGGLTIKSSRSQVGIWGNSLYMQSMKGPITMSSQDGAGEFIVYCGQLTKYLKSGSTEVIAIKLPGETPTESLSVLEHVPGFLNYYGSQVNLGVDSVNVIPVRTTNTSATLVVSGNITSEGTVSGVGEFRKTSVVRPSSLTNIRTSAHNDLVSANGTLNTDLIRDITGPTANGNVEVYSLIGFNFRDSSELGLGDMIIYEAEWQKRFRQTAGIVASAKYTSVWEEPDVAGRVESDGTDDAGRLTLPFPGKDAWDNGTGAKYAQVDDQFYVSDTQGGRPLPRGEKGVAYKTVTPPPISEEPFKDRYPINR